jgi:hypothetical protein
LPDRIDVPSRLDPENSPSGAYQAINPVELPHIDRAAVTSGAADGIYVEPPGTRREYERYPSEFVDDPDEVGLFAGGIGLGAYWYPPIYTAAINQAALVGYRTFLTPEKQFFTDEGYEEDEVFQLQLNRISRPDAFGNEKTGLAPTGHDNLFQFHPGDRAHHHVEGNALVLCSDEPLSYGSFLFRVLPKVKTVRALGLTDAPCIVYAQQKPFMDLLNLCGIQEKNIIQHDMDAILHVDRAIVPSMRDPHAYLDPESFDLYAELREAYGVRPQGRKVYVSRFALNQTGRGATRVMVNEEELIERLRSMDFDIVEPETLSVREQIMIFSSASIIVGPSGSGLFNTMFCHPGTKVIDIQSEPHWIYSYTGMYASLKLEYGIFLGKPDPLDTRPVHRVFTVNIEALVARVRSFMAEASW